MSKQGNKRIEDMTAEEYCDHRINIGMTKPEHREETLTVLTWLESGQEAAKKISEKCVKNLYKAGMAEKGKLITGMEGPNELWFLIAVTAANCGLEGAFKDKTEA